MFVDLDTIRYLWPEVILVLCAAWIYFGGTIRPARAWWTGFAVATYLLSGLVMFGSEGALVGRLAAGGLATGPIVVDYLGWGFRWLALFLGVMFTVLSLRDAEREMATERLGTLMLLVAGLMLVARANDLVFLFVSLELISIPTYVLLYLGRRDQATSEATLKYFYLSVLSSALLLYGMSFFYGLAGTTALRELPDLADARHLAAASALARLGIETATLIYFALALIVAGLGFKMAAVPFHFYAPDVYQGATNINAGLLAIVPKIAGVLAFVRLVVLSFPEAATSAWQLSLILAIMTMTLGNVCALWQQNLRRLLAYSSIAHAGYLLIGLSVALAAAEGALDSAGGVSAALLYLFVYALASLGCFAALVYLSGQEDEVNEVAELSGLGRTRPLIAAALTICLFSLTGIPPLAGFWGKLALFFGAVQTALGAQTGHTALWFTLLAVIGALNAAIAAAYYLRVIAAIYFGAPGKPLRAAGGWGAWTVAMSSAVLLVVVGLFPRAAFEAARSSEQSSRAPLSALGEASNGVSRNTVDSGANGGVAAAESARPRRSRVWQEVEPTSQGPWHAHVPQ